MIYKLLGEKLITWDGIPIQIIGLVFSPRAELYRVVNLRTGAELDLNITTIRKAIRNQDRIKKWFRNESEIITNYKLV